ncbi:hypothetical protein [Streptomyces sp. MMBL 11-3]|uniref:DUF6197 family protein n=1 Tax=Streptomyces sp. MMBL 11-3 TaxID=3382639 RepID=UPI0039B672E3
MSTVLHLPGTALPGTLPDDTYGTYEAHDAYEAHDTYDAHDVFGTLSGDGRARGREGEVFRRSALLIARRGWCQGQGLVYVGSSHDPQAASLVGALTWAVTGDARSCGPEVRAVLATVRAHLDPADSALFSDWELLCAWNDAPARTREELIALLLLCHHSAVAERAAGPS